VRRLTLALGLALTLAQGTANLAHGQPGSWSGSRSASLGYGSWSASPDQIVRSGVDRLTGFLIGVPEVTPENLGSFLDLEIAPLFDFDYMAKWSAGTYWPRLDANERARLGAKLGSMFLDALARNLGTYVEPLPRIDVFPARRAGPSEARVSARVTGERGMRVRLDFRFYLSARGWRVFDVAANGASAVAYYRGYFRELLRRKGPAALTD